MCQTKPLLQKVHFIYMGHSTSNFSDKWELKLSMFQILERYIFQKRSLNKLRLSVCTYVKFMSICHRNLWVQSLSFLALYFLSYGFVSSIYYNFSKFLHINLYFSIEITGLIWTRYLKATYAPERKWHSVTTHLKSWICLLATKEKLCYVS